GNFAQAFSELQQHLPLNTLQSFSPRSLVEKMIGRSAINIYAMEGEILLDMKYHIHIKSTYYQYPSNLFQLGEINSTLVANYDAGFFTMEAKNALDILDDDEVERCIASIYEKDHLALMQLNYIKAKLNFDNKKLIDSQLIQSLVIVNPYTRGLQLLMLAFADDTPTEATALYEQALSNLTHIKYYYVEALLYYARYLQQQNLQSKFTKIYQEGYDLSCKHHYRWLRYQFEGLIGKKTSPYNAADYPLPEALDIEDYIQWLIKQNREH
ncbi:MAG: hypothetical protein K0Q78_2781, partial [Cellvibrio sp.]|nr:hypothetical protein [Cellvibrio sp.]